MIRIMDPKLVKEAYEVMDAAVTAILMTEPVLASIATEFNIVFTKSIPTAGVSRQGRKLMYWINPEWVLKGLRWDPIDRHFAAIELNKHEIFHVMFEHLAGKRFPETEDMWLARMQNIAQDMAINSLLNTEKMPKSGLYPGMKIPLKNLKGIVELQEFFQNSPRGESSEFYLNSLLRILKGIDKKKLKDTIFDPDYYLPGDCHEIEDEGSQEGEMILREVLQRRLREGMNTAKRTNRWGSVSASIREWLEHQVSTEVDWASLLNNFVGRVSTKARTGHLMRTHRHSIALGHWVKAGNVAKEIARVFLFIDESGSMSDENVAKAISEAAGAAKETEVILVPFDQVVNWDKREVLKRGKKPQYQRVLAGGTNFQAVAEFLKSTEAAGCQAAVICTDGYAPHVESWPRLPILWLITEDGTTDSVNANHLLVKMDGGGAKKAVKR